MAKEKKLDLHSYLVSKLRSASRKWPPINDSVKRVKVPVSVEYSEDHHGKYLTATLPDGSTVTVVVYKKCQSRDRVMFRCEKCDRYFFDYEFLPTKKGGKLKKTAMIARDHVEPIIDPAKGFEGWDKYIDRMFNGAIQILCNYPGLRDGVESCHHQKTAKEKAIQTERIRKEKGIVEAPTRQKGRKKK